jgi:hypothetical protein
MLCSTRVRISLFENRPIIEIRLHEQGTVGTYCNGIMSETIILQSHGDSFLVSNDAFVIWQDWFNCVKIAMTDIMNGLIWPVENFLWHNATFQKMDDAFLRPLDSILWSFDAIKRVSDTLLEPTEAINWAIDAPLTLRQTSLTFRQTPLTLRQMPRSLR